MPHSENCRQLVEMLSDYVDGELSKNLCADLEKHLAGCENCRIVVDTMRKTVYLYRVASSSPTLPTDVRERLYRCLDLEDYSKR